MRKARAYSKKHTVPYTRISKKRQKAYVKTVPQSKIVKFNMGNLEMYKEGKFSHVLTLVSAEKVQIRQNALEASRQFINKKLDKELNGQYFYKIIPFTHHIQRENKMLTAAGADRMQTGMQLSFGKTIAKAAILKENDRIMLVAVATPKAVSIVRHIFKQIKSKLPCKTKVLYELKNNSD